MRQYTVAASCGQPFLFYTSGMDESPFVEAKKEPVKFGPIVGIIILIAIFVAGGVYFFLHEKARLDAPPVQETINA